MNKLRLVRDRSALSYKVGRGIGAFIVVAVLVLLAIIAVGVLLRVGHWAVNP